jgi:glutamate/tyrosine decarboxylase-like PLP-dependent enzyme
VLPQAAEPGNTPDTALFPVGSEQERLESFLADLLAERCSRLGQGSVTPTFDLNVFRGELARFDFAKPQALEELLSWAIAQMVHGIVQTTHPRYFGLFNPAPTFPAKCADRIVGAFNPQLASLKTSPAAVEIESHVIRAVGCRAGFGPEATGHFTTGGTEANFTALLCALMRANTEYGTIGVRAFPFPPLIYVSGESHLAWLKIAHQAGIGRHAVRFVGTDGTGRMDAAALVHSIRSDVAAGAVPVMIVATAGTTSAGMIDPLLECATISRQFGLWYHVDAAWGGALIASEQRRNDLAGLELADSMTIDAHKWFATTMGCGMFITPHRSMLSSVFHVSADFMPSSIEGVDPYLTSLQWSRRFAGLRLFLALAAAGWNGYEAHVEKAISLATLLRDSIVAKGWSVLNASSMAVVCVVPPPNSAAPRTIVERVLASGRAWVSVTRFEGREVIRACITNGTSTPADIAELVEALEAAR